MESFETSRRPIDIRLPCVWRGKSLGGNEKRTYIHVHVHDGLVPIPLLVSYSLSLSLIICRRADDKKGCGAQQIPLIWGVWEGDIEREREREREKERGSGRTLTLTLFCCSLSSLSPPRGRAWLSDRKRTDL